MEVLARLNGVRSNGQVGSNGHTNDHTNGHSTKSTWPSTPASFHPEDVGPALSHFQRPVRVEGDIYNVEVEGEIPKEIAGTFYRIMPDPAFPPYLKDDIVSSACKTRRRNLLTISHSGSMETGWCLRSALKTGISTSNNATLRQKS